MKVSNLTHHLSIRAVIVGLGVMLLTACISPIEGKYSEQQKRMMRCDQYIEAQRDMCLRGETVTIDDYKDDYKDYKKSKAKEEEANKAAQQAIPPIKPIPPTRPLN